MLTFSGSLKIFVAVEPCDMRTGFNGLHAMVSEWLGASVCSWYLQLLAVMKDDPHRVSMA